MTFFRDSGESPNIFVAPFFKRTRVHFCRAVFQKNQNANKRLVSVALRLEGDFSQRLLDQLPQVPTVGAFLDAIIQRVEAAFGSRAGDVADV